MENMVWPSLDLVSHYDNRPAVSALHSPQVWISKLSEFAMDLHLLSRLVSRADLVGFGAHLKGQSHRDLYSAILGRIDTIWSVVVACGPPVGVARIHIY